MHNVRSAQPPQIASTNLTGSQNFAPGGGWEGQGVLTLAEDDTFGVYVQSLQVGSLTAFFAPCSICRIDLWKQATSARTTLTGTQINVTYTRDATTGIIALVAEATGYNGILIEATITPIQTGVRITQRVVNTDPDYSVEDWDFPRLGCKADSGTASNAAIAHGFLTGFTVMNPHLKTFAPGASVPATYSPAAMQFWDYYDIQTKLHVYVSTDDEQGWHKEWILEGDGSAVSVQSWRHHPMNPRIAGNGGTVPQGLTYGVSIEVFRGQTQDGRCGHYDAALRYRAWSTASTRPWMSEGAWEDRADIPDRVKNSDFYYVIQTPQYATQASTMIEDARRIKAFIGADEILVNLYDWGINQHSLIGTTFKPPEFTPVPYKADIETALAAADSNDIHVSLYTIPHPWDTRLTAGGGARYPFNDFIASFDWSDLSQYVIRDKDGVVLTSDTLAFFDLNSADIADIADLIRDTFTYDGVGGFGSANIGYYTQFTNHPHGFYWDLWTGISTLLQQDESVSPNGNVGDAEDGHITVSDTIRNAVRVLDPDAYFSGEGNEEMMIPHIDIMHEGFIVRPWGTNSDLFSIVHSRYTPVYDLSVTLNDPAFTDTPPSTQFPFYLSWVMYRWHQTGGHLCLTNGKPYTVVPVNPPTILNCPLYPVLLMMKRVVDRFASNPAIKTYMHEGLRCRPLPSSPEGFFVESGDDHSDATGYSMYGTADAQLMSSVWQMPDTGEIGIVLTSTRTADADVNIYMEAEAYDLDPFKPYTLFSNVDGVRTELTRFVGTLDWDVTLVFDGQGGALDLLEVVASV